MAGFGALAGRPRATPQAKAGVWRGKVTKIEAGRPFVELDRETQGYEYGPLEQVETPTALVAGDRVLVAFVEGRAGDPIVLGRLAE